MSKDTRPFNFTINAAEFFAEIESKINKKDLVNWIEQFSKDLITLLPKTDYGKKVVQQTIDYIEKQSANGAKGGRPPKTQTKAVVLSGLTQTISQTEPKQKPNETYKNKNKNNNKEEEIIPPDISDVIAYCKERQNDVDANKWFNYYASKGWKIGDKAKMVSWKAAVHTWEKKSVDTKPKQMVMNMNGIMVEVD